jgi:tetratricopeptide (TPR) repeat protein
VTDQAVDTSGIEVPQQGQRGALADPLTSSQFLGRTQELKELTADIERAGLDTLAGRKAPRARVLLIAGRPGSGRTALAEEFVRRITESGSRYPDGALRARLTEPDGTPVPTAGIARGLLGALRLPAPPGAAEDDLTATLRDALATRRAVLLLDGATRAEQVDRLLPDTPDSLVVAVSEGPLTGIPDVRPCTLGGLDTPSAVRLLSHFTGSVRITCDPRSAEYLAEECGRMPAALLLAGGWLGARPRASVADLAVRLRGATSEGDVSPLARLFGFVHADLPAPAARVLRLLSLAPAGLADPQTASALAGCSVTAAHAALDDLSALGLLRKLDSPLPQYTVPDCLLPLLRRLTRTQDRPAELQLARARMLERNVTLLHSCRAVTGPDGSPARRKHASLPRSLRFPSRAAAGHWLAIRRPALLAAARTAVADADLDTLARRLMAALVRALAAHHGTEAVAAELYDIHELVLRLAERRGLHREQAAALLNLADLDARAGRTQAAIARYRSALDAGRGAKDPYATGRAMESLGAAYQELGDGPRAVDWFTRALAQHLARDERTDTARLHGRIAGAQAQQGRHAEALRSWRAAVAGYRKAGDVPGQAHALSELARVQEYAGRYEEAMRTCREAVEWALRARDERLQAALHLRLAGIHGRLGDPEAARLHRMAGERMLGEKACGGDVGPVDREDCDAGPVGDQTPGSPDPLGPPEPPDAPVSPEPPNPVKASQAPDIPRAPGGPAVTAVTAGGGGQAATPDRSPGEPRSETPPSTYESRGLSAAD